MEWLGEDAKSMFSVGRDEVSSFRVGERGAEKRIRQLITYLCNLARYLETRPESRENRFDVFEDCRALAGNGGSGREGCWRATGSLLAYLYLTAPTPERTEAWVLEREEPSQIVWRVDCPSLLASRSVFDLSMWLGSSSLARRGFRVVRLKLPRVRDGS